MVTAAEKVPGLETVDLFVLRTEVQNLSAKIKAKRMVRLPFYSRR
jgi:hypothetical protein